MPYRDLPTIGRRELEQALRDANWNRSEAARRLGCSRSTLYRLIRAWGIVEVRSIQRVI